MTRSIHRLAAADLEEAFDFYRREGGRGLATRFLGEFERVVALLDEHPGFGTQTEDGRRVFPLVEFPYSIIYAYREGDLRILVLRHQHRDPAFGEARR